MTGIQNFLMLIYQNWITILVCVGLVVGIIKRTIWFMAKTDDEKIEIAKTQITQTMLKMVCKAEIDYDSWNSAGAIKRSQVIAEIFDKYPILGKVIEQDEVIAWLDEQIDESLKILKGVVEHNEKK